MSASDEVVSNVGLDSYCHRKTRELQHWTSCSGGALSRLSLWKGDFQHCKSNIAFLIALQIYIYIFYIN